MGKTAKAHRAKIEKRNKKVSNEKYAMQNALNKLMKQMAEQQEVEKLNVTVGEQEVPFSVVDEAELNSIVEFKEQNGKMFEPQVEDQISELEK
jgi:hypothetical protein